MAQNAERELDREKRYRQYFADLDKKRSLRAEAHEQSVGGPIRHQEEQLQDWIRRHEAERSQRLQADEQQRRSQKAQELLKTNEVVRKQMSAKELDKEAYKLNYPKRAEENLFLGRPSFMFRCVPTTIITLNSRRKRHLVNETTMRRYRHR